MKRVITKLGDVFCAQIDSNHKRYFQYVANDLNQLNSNVIRAFKKCYLSASNADLSIIIEDEIDFYAHCSVSHGIKLTLWEKVGNVQKEIQLNDVLFRGTNDYGSKIGEQKIVSSNWYVWKIADKGFTKVGRLKSEHLHSYIGLVINPYGIMELLKGNKYPVNYPEY
ncbi:MAG: hypothetical protein V4553_03405 [Bacteroidota bacterium]